MPNQKKKKKKTLIEQLHASLYAGPGATSPTLRRKIRQRVRDEVQTGEAQALPDAVLEAYIAKMTRHAYRIEDADFEALRQAGYDESKIFEVSVAAAFSAGMARLDRITDLLNSEER